MATKRVKTASTASGVTIIAALLAQFLAPDAADLVAQGVMAAVGLFEVWRREHTPG